jgi:hypothetical protein
MLMKLFFLKIIGFVSILLLTAWLFDHFANITVFNVKYRKFVFNSKWDYLKNRDNRIDILILGSSKGYLSYDPSVIDSLTGKKSFNMGTPMQSLKESYYILKEVLDSRKISFVIVDILWDILDSVPDMINAYSNYIHLSFSDRIGFSLHDDHFCFLVSSIFPIRVYSPKLVNSLSDLFKNNDKPIDSSRWYKGFYAETSIFSTEKEVEKATIFKKKISQFNYKYLHQIIELCKKTNCQLLFIISPVPEMVKKELVGKNHLHEDLKKVINGAHFFDYIYSQNLVHYNNNCFADQQHLNRIGARLFSCEISRIILQMQ